MAFAIREGIHLCVCGDQVILLDLQTERYFALPRSQNDILRRWLTNQAISDDETSVLRRLEQLQILCSTEGDREGTDPKSPEVPAPIAALDTNGVRASLLGIIGAVIARLIWAWRIKHWRFDRQMCRLRETRRRAPSRRSIDAREIVRAFEFSDFLLGSHDKCLERSFALAAVCQRQGLSAQAVIGVQKAPFAAHCWVQHGHMIYNEKPDRAKLFAPILAI